MPVPVVNLADPSCEPSDEELAALMRSVSDEAARRHEAARERFMTALAEGIRKGAAGLGPSGTRPDEDHRRPES